MGKAGGWSLRLLEAAISCSDEINFGLTLEDGRTQDLVGNLDVLAELVKDRVDARQGEEPEGPLAFVVEHADGLRTVTLMLNGAVGDFCYAASVEGGVGDDEGIVATTSLRSPGPSKIVILSRFAVLSVSLTQKVSLFQIRIWGGSLFLPQA